MASSSYYYNLYKKNKNKAEDYEDNLKDLGKILDNLHYDLFDEILDVNDRLDRLIDDLTKGVRHNSRFASSANSLANEKEKSVGADRDLSTTQDELEDEIARVRHLKSEAISDKDYYYRKYKEKKAEEKAALAKKLLGGGE
ncbi:hypothetical protein LCM10_08020 [Rossellomorea aquimaris]|uniref:hypothetical protein n=1 Tax=Rossellomorea aquimaris TaxID=189382 RepID=UPI001CD49736|nr:hypothetical protein [Rossellomorea aquimaris]MCA1054928.1 hypothetical protein [Rossellomorea aquimaris]